MDYKAELEERQPSFEQKTQDILHYVELCEMGDEERLEIIEKIMNTRKMRRDMKDELQRIEIFQQAIGSKSNLNKCKNMIQHMANLEEIAG